MSSTKFLYHQKISDSDCCGYCLEIWPCPVAVIVTEAADYITERAAHHAEFQREGMEYAAMLIRPC